MTDERRSPPGERVTLRGNAVLPLVDPGVWWLLESGTIGLFGAALDARTTLGPRRFLASVKAGDALFGIGAPGTGRPGVVAVALEECRLLRVRRGAAGEAEAEQAARWRRSWHEALVGLPGEETGLDEFHRALLVRLGLLAGAHEAAEAEEFASRARRSREITTEAVSELTGVLAREADALPQGSDLFVAAHVVGRAGGLRLRQPADWRQTDPSDDPVARIADASHVRSRRVLLHDGWMHRDCGPLLAFTRRERKPLALLPRCPGRYDVFDPAGRSRQRLTSEVARSLERRAYVFYAPLPERAASGVALLRFALRGRGRDLLVLLGAATAATLLGMVTPQVTALLIDHAIPDSDLGLLGQLGLALVAAALGAAVFRFAQGIALVRLETVADVVTQSAVWDRLLALQLSFFRSFSTGDLLSRVTAMSQIRARLSGTTLRSLFSSVVALLNLGLLLYYSPVLTVVALAIAIASAALTVGSGALILRCYREILELKGRFFGLLVQLIHGVAKLRVAGAEERAFGQWARSYARLARLEYRQRVIRDNVHVANLALSTAGVVCLFALAAALVRTEGAEGGLTIGVFLAFHVAFGTFIGAVAGLSNTITDVMAIAILRERVKPILEQPREVNERKGDPGPLAGAVQVEQVVFRYRTDGPLILDGIRLRAAAGEFVALVGPSGSGKSTLFRLLLGFEDPQSGKILYDGQDLAGLDMQAVRHQMGVVLQEGRINAGSLFENVVCGTQRTLKDAWEAARATGFAQEIEAMPMGMHTMVSEGGTNLSGGQRQRLLLTRALVHKPRLLLLDEATSALDNRTQAIVSRSLADLAVTRLVIAHRLSTVRPADRIYVLESGRIVQQGSFEELARQGGLFSRLMARQMT